MKSARFRKPVMTSFAQKKHSDFAPFVIEARQEVWPSALFPVCTSIVALAIVRASPGGVHARRSRANQLRKAPS